MTNLCTRSVPAGATSGSNNYVPQDSHSAQVGVTNQYQPVYSNGGVKVGSNHLLQIPVGGAFDAETYGISCQAFSNAATSIVSLQTAITSIQTQVNLLTNLSNTSSVGFEERMSDQSAVWSLFLVAVVVVLCVRGIYNLFNRSPHEGT